MGDFVLSSVDALLHEGRVIVAKASYPGSDLPMQLRPRRSSDRWLFAAGLRCDPPTDRRSLSWRHPGASGLIRRAVGRTSGHKVRATLRRKKDRRARNPPVRGRHNHEVQPVRLAVVSKACARVRGQATAPPWLGAGMLGRVLWRSGHFGHRGVQLPGANSQRPAEGRLNAALV